MSLRLCARRIALIKSRFKKYQFNQPTAVSVSNLCNPVCLTKAPIFTDRQLNLPTTDNQSRELDKYLLASNETLETLSEYFEEILEGCDNLVNADVEYGDGVLTIKFGEPHGTYVINRQVPNLQLWLSSPTSGPKRYDLVDGHWVYRHNGVTLHTLLNEEIPKIVKKNVNFNLLPFSIPQVNQ